MDTILSRISNPNVINLFKDTAQDQVTDMHKKSIPAGALSGMLTNTPVNTYEFGESKQYATPELSSAAIAKLDTSSMMAVLSDLVKAVQDKLHTSERHNKSKEYTNTLKKIDDDKTEKANKKSEKTSFLRLCLHIVITAAIVVLTIRSGSSSTNSKASGLLKIASLITDKILGEIQNNQEDQEKKDELENKHVGVKQVVVPPKKEITLEDIIKQIMELFEEVKKLTEDAANDSKEQDDHVQSYRHEMA